MVDKSYAASEGDDGDSIIDIPSNLYVYPPEIFFETIPGDIITRIMSNFDEPTYEAMCLRRPSPFWGDENSGSCFSRIVISTTSYGLTYSPRGKTIAMGDGAVVQKLVSALKAHAAFITELNFSGAYTLPKLYNLVAKYCDPKKVARINITARGEKIYGTQSVFAPIFEKFNRDIIHIFAIDYESHAVHGPSLSEICGNASRVI